MENFSKPHHIEKRQLLDLLFALIAEVVAFGVCVPFFSLIVKQGPLIQDCVDVAGEISSPTVGRLVFGIVAFTFGIGLTFLAHFLNKKNKEIFSFASAFAGGVFLWQSIGECLWHFQIGGVQIMRIESVQSFPLVIIFIILLIVFGLFKNKNFAIWVCVLSFACNWLGHFITLGTYPFVNGVDWKLWCYTMSAVFGGIATLLGLFLSLFCCKSKKGIYYASILLFIGIGVIYFGFTEA